MIKSLPIQDKMRVRHRWTSTLFVMSVLCLTLNADGETCENGIKVRRHTTYEAVLGGQLRIPCPVQFCNGSTPTIKWFKLEEHFVELNFSDNIQTEWMGKKYEGTHFLIFNNIQTRDLGSVQCRVGTDVSHTINITLKGNNVNDTFPTHQNSTSTDNSHNRHLWLYLYTTVGIVGIVIIVTVISVISIRGCNGETKKTQTENPYMDIPMVEQPVHHSSHHTLPRSPREPPPHRTSRKKHSPSVPRQMDNDYGHRPRDEGRSVVYAALNHQQLATASSRPRAVVEEVSEYAAIKVS